MLKKIIVGVLVGIVVVAVGTSWYNARADQSAAAVSNLPAGAAGVADLQIQPEAASTSTAGSAEAASQVGAAIHAPAEQGAAVQGQGAWVSAETGTWANQGRGRSQNMQANLQDGTATGEPTRLASGYRGGRSIGGQTNGTPKGRPSWAGQGQGG